MIIDNAGTYTLRYTATDDCGKTTTVDRELIVEYPLRTVLYTDGTLVINERGEDIPQNVGLHGEPLYLYDPLDENHDYVFSTFTTTPWYNERAIVSNVEIGSKIVPTNMSYWFYGMNNCVSFELNNIDCKELVELKSTFKGCSSVEHLDLSFLGTERVEYSKVESINGTLRDCTALKSVTFGDFSGYNTFDMDRTFQGCTSLEVIDMNEFVLDVHTYSNRSAKYSFYSCASLTTIYCKSSTQWSIADDEHGVGTFGNCSTMLVGGSGTVWSASRISSIYAKLDGGVQSSGYFTAKS